MWPATTAWQAQSFGLAVLRHNPLMVRSAKRVSNHEATNGPASFETRALRAPQDEESERLWRSRASAQGGFALACVEGFAAPVCFATNGKSHYSDLTKL